MNRLRQIDLLRALAVLLVLGRHMAPCPADTSGFLHHFTKIWFQGGWIGVDLFFVLSGFLVSGLLFREHEKFGQINIGHFLIRRGFKIYPSFWLLIAFTVIVQIWRTPDAPLRGLVPELLFVQNYFGGMWNHTWSLAVEEHFYFLLALVCWWCARRWPTQPFRLIPAAFVVVAVLSLGLRLGMAAVYPYKNTTHVFPSHLRLDGLFFGVLLSYWFHRDRAKFLLVARRFRYALAGLGVLLLTPAFCYSIRTTPFIYTYGLTLFYLGSGCLLVSALGWNVPATGLANGVAYIGSRSYSVYLWHMPVAAWGVDLVRPLFSSHDNWYLYASIYLWGSIAVGVGMALLAEFPILRIRDRLFPSRGTT
jgi:peptidoglycan/LPS O-acetylase OafA/YrhL